MKSRTEELFKSVIANGQPVVSRLWFLYLLFVPLGLVITSCFPNAIDRGFRVMEK